MRELATWEEPRELDTDNEAVISLYDGIKKILEKNRSQRPSQALASPEKQDTSYSVVEFSRSISNGNSWSLL